ncbi:hypothetical protein [Nocardia ignorata]|uniref:Uncharacterized protein n=1 Tax=Nocardia ignorata TaxID=145285 RepID=A0A4R6NYL0_NOCIG|nr:hypothetical protein [Nocardia ignorata]TDP29866.1 hypothetical protein DFR75_112135 [Nocardia ignorata]
MTTKKQLRAELARAQAEAADWRIRHDLLAQAFSAVTGSARYVTLPADQFDQLMAEVDQADPAPKLAEAAAKPRTFGVMRRAACGCLVPEHMLHVNGRAECVDFPKCSGNPDVPCDTESGNFPNIGAA